MILVPLVDSKILVEQHYAVDLKFIENNPVYNTYKFQITSDKDFSKYRNIFTNPQPTYIQFTSFYNDNLFLWQGVISKCSEFQRVILVQDVVVTNVRKDARKERLFLKERAMIHSIRTGEQVIDFNGKKIPIITKNISETGILLCTTIDLSSINIDDNHLSVEFLGKYLSPLNTKRVKIIRLFRDDSFFYYGCQFILENYDDILQVSKAIARIKLENGNDYL